MQFILFASILAIAAAYPGYYSSGHDVGGYGDYAQIAQSREGHHHESYPHAHEDEHVDYYVSFIEYDV